MKRAGLIAGGIFLVAVAALLIGPSFVDWTAYRDTFERQIEAATGRSIDIDGDVSMAVLPRPALSIEGVRIGSVQGATSEDFLAADSVSVNLAFAPLLSGRVQFSSIEIVRPVILAEVLADGRATWQFATETDDLSAAEGMDAPSGKPIDLGIDNLVITDGTVRYRDVVADTAYDIEGITAEISAGSISGPFDVRGRAVALGAEWDVESSLGFWHEDRPTPVAIYLSAPDSGLSMQFTGQAVTAGNQPQLTGRIEVSGDRLDASVAAFGGDPRAFDGMAAAARPITVKGAVEAAASGSLISDLDIAIGDLTIQGQGAYDWLPHTRFAATLRVGRFNIDSWTEGSVEPINQFAIVPALSVIHRARAQSNDAGFELPADLVGELDVTIDLLEWRGQVLRNGRFAASIAGGEITVTDSGVELPGNTSMTSSGFVRAERSEPQIDMTARLVSQNVRGLLAWWDVEPPADVVPPGRLNALVVDSRIVGSPDDLQFPGLTIKLDSTELKGEASVVAGTPIKAGVDLTVSSVDLDSYLPALRDRLAARDAAPVQSAATQSARPSEAQPPNTFASVDATVKVQADSVTAGGYVIRGVDIDASTTAGVLKLTRFDVADVAGLAIAAAGTIFDITSAPRFDAFRIQAQAPDPLRVARAFEVNVPRLSLLGRPVTVDASLTGTQASATLTGKAAIGNVSIDLTGVASAAAVPSFSGAVSLGHPDYTKLMRDLDMALPADAPSPGAVAAKAEVSVSGSVLNVSSFNISAGSNAATGALKIDAQEQGTDVSGTIAIVDADLDALLPVDETAALTQQSRARTARASGQNTSRWSTEPLPQHIFDGLTVSMIVTAERVTGRGLEIETLQAPVKISGGTLDVTGWTASVFGGIGGGELKMVSGAGTALAAFIDIKDMELSRTGGAAGGSTKGTLSFQGAFSGQGASQRDLVASLDGRGVLAARGIDTGRTGAAGIVGTLISPIRAVSQLGGLLSGGVTKGLASMDASFAGEQGVFTLSNATLKSNVYSGEFQGDVDLPRWWVDIQGRVRLEANLITQLLGNRIQMPSLIPVTVVGPLDAPNVKTDTAPAPAGSTSAEPSATQQAEPAQPVAPQPVDLFRGILNELTKPK